MAELAIGTWVRRTGGKWHLVESVVAEDAVTRCGRRMDRFASGGELQVSEVMLLTRAIGQPQLCRGGCQREVTAPEPAESEDDGSTANEVADA